MEAKEGMLAKKKSPGRRKPQSIPGTDLTLPPKTRRMLSRDVDNDVEALLDLSPQNNAEYAAPKGKEGREAGREQAGGGHEGKKHT